MKLLGYADLMLISCTSGFLRDIRRAAVVELPGKQNFKKNQALTLIIKCPQQVVGGFVWTKAWTKHPYKSSPKVQKCLGSCGYRIQLFYFKDSLTLFL